MLIGINHATTQSNWLPSLILFSLTVMPCWDDHIYSLDTLSFFLDFIISSMLQYILFFQIMKSSGCSFEIIKTQGIWSFRLKNSSFQILFSIYYLIWQHLLSHNIINDTFICIIFNLFSLIWDMVILFFLVYSGFFFPHKKDVLVAFFKTKIEHGLQNLSFPCFLSLEQGRNTVALGCSDNKKKCVYSEV